MKCSFLCVLVFLCAAFSLIVSAQDYGPIDGSAYDSVDPIDRSPEQQKILVIGAEEEDGPYIQELLDQGYEVHVIVAPPTAPDALNYLITNQTSVTIHYIDSPETLVQLLDTVVFE